MSIQFESHMNTQRGHAGMIGMAFNETEEIQNINLSAPIWRFRAFHYVMYEYDDVYVICSLQIDCISSQEEESHSSQHPTRYSPLQMRSQKENNTNRLSPYIAEVEEFRREIAATKRKKPGKIISCIPEIPLPRHLAVLIIVISQSINSLYEFVRNGGWQAEPQGCLLPYGPGQRSHLGAVETVKPNT